MTVNWRAVAIGAALGAVVPIAFLVWFALSEHGTEAVLLFWPSSVMVMGSEAGPASQEWRLLVPSIQINVAVYAVLGGAFSATRETRGDR